jgi:hypothetical protein
VNTSLAAKGSSPTASAMATTNATSAASRGPRRRSLASWRSTRRVSDVTCAVRRASSRPVLVLRVHASPSVERPRTPPNGCGVDWGSRRVMA